MPRTKKPANRGPTEATAPAGMGQAAAAFAAQVEEALRHFHDPAWLGEHSPLASPYFLGGYLTEVATLAPERGAVLQHLLQAAVAALDGGETPITAENAMKPQNILALSFLDPQAKSRSLHVYIEAAYGIPKTTYYRNLSRALERVSAELVRRINPALRLETAPVPPALPGRDDLLARCGAALRAGQSISLTGAGGVGKTALAACLAAAYQAPAAQQATPAGAVFWFTVRPGLNDQPGSLLFALAYFLHHRGASSLWLQMVADKGRTAFGLAQGMLHYALQHLEPPRPLLCFDELDLLRPAEIEAHAHLLTLLESLRGLAPLLCIGQYPVVETATHVDLPGLTLEQLQHMLAAAGLELRADEQAQFWHATRGNPRLVELALALHQSGDALVGLLDSGPALRSYGFVLDRFWQRLGADERELLLALAVFRRSAPGDGWNEAALQTLLARHLVQTDGRGGVEVLPVFKAAAESRLVPEQRDEVHLQAAAIRAQRSEWTEAAYHYIRAGRVDMAVWLWDKHREQEIGQGQGTAALDLFGAISSQQVDAETGAVLLALRSELKLLPGNYPGARQDAQAGAKLAPGIASARLRRVEGDIADLHDELEDAVRAYRAGLSTVEALMKEALLFRRDIAWVLMRSADLQQAWQEACRARYEAENMQGYVQERMGEYAAAHARFAAALHLAEAVGDAQRAANIRNNLGRLLIWMGDYTAAQRYLEAARSYCEETGYQTLLASVQMNQSLGALQAGDPASASEHAAAALGLFEQFGEPWGQATALLNLAEARLALGHVQEAEDYAWQVVQKEIVDTSAEGLRVLGEVRLAQHAYAAAAALIHQSIEYARQSEDMLSEGYSWRVLYQICRAQGDEDGAVAARAQAIALFRGLHMPHEIAKVAALDPAPPAHPPPADAE